MQYISSLIRKPKQRTPVAQPSSPSGTAAEAGSSSSSSNKLVFLGNGHTYSFDFEDLLSASAEVLGKGSMGTSYKAVLREGTTVVTKRLREVVVTESEFVIQMEVLGKVRHDNVVPLRAYYISKHEKLLIYDYMAYGTVASHLQGSRSRALDLNWGNRRKIALSTAKGIAHLHMVSKLVHGNIKSSNIFLRPGADVALSYFGLNPFCGYTTPPNKVAGYCAPEILETRKVTYQSDVYSFGVLLLELLTGKAPNHASLVAEGMNLPRWVQSVLSVQWSDEVFDAELMRYDHSEIERVSLLQIALSCVSYVPEQRPNIQEVVHLIEDLNQGGHRHSYDVTSKSTDARNSSSVDVVSVNKLVYLGNKAHSYGLEDLLGASNDTLGVGSCGVSFKAGLKDGTTVVVKRLKGVVVTKSEFASHMKVLENIKHDNVVPLKAYYFSEDEKLIVSNYANSSSLSSLLHGCRGSGPAPLDWEHRKKISLSTAKGIAHLHTTGKLFHGNIKSSNVLLILDHDAALSDFGLNALFGSATPANQDVGYSAPELIETKKVTFQSDVYSLGILLLELITGKAPNQTSSGEGAINLPTWVRSAGREEWTSKVFDQELKRDSNIEQEMVSLLQIAMACVSNVPDQRPEIHEVVCLIENLIILNGERPMVG